MPRCRGRATCSWSARPRTALEARQTASDGPAAINTLLWRPEAAGRACMGGALSRPRRRRSRFGGRAGELRRRPGMTWLIIG